MKKLKLAQRKKQHLYNNRVGQKAQNMKKFFKTKMSLEEMTNTQTNTINSHLNATMIPMKTTVPIIQHHMCTSPQLSGRGQI